MSLFERYHKKCLRSAPNNKNHENAELGLEPEPPLAPNNERISYVEEEYSNQNIVRLLCKRILNFEIVVHLCYVMLLHFIFFYVLQLIRVNSIYILFKF